METISQDLFTNSRKPQDLCLQAIKFLKGDGVEYNFTKAKALLEEAAENGYVPAQYNLGVLLMNGEFFGKNDQEGIKWITQAAENGFLKAQIKIGDHYRDKDHLEAAKWYIKAIQQGSKDAEKCLNSLYRKYLNVFTIQELLKIASENEPITWYYLGEKLDETEPERALTYTLKSANLGYAPAQNDMGVYNHSIKNFEEAFSWYKKAADQKNDAALYNLGNYFYYGISVDVDFSKAMEYYEASSYPKAKYKLAEMYEKGEGIEEPDHSKALRYYERCKNEIPKAKLKIGEFYEEGKGGLEQNIEQALELYTEISSKELKALSRMANIYKQYKKDLGKALELYERAYKAGDIYAGCRLAYEYATSSYKDVDKAIELYRKCLEELGENHTIEFNIGYLYYTAKDFKNAFNWLKLAEEHGSNEANFFLEKMYYNGQGVEKQLDAAFNHWRKFKNIKKLDNQNLSDESIQSLPAISDLDYEIPIGSGMSFTMHMILKDLEL